MWRYRELLPVRHDANIVTLGEGMTPLLRVSDRVSARLGFKGGRLSIKDEGKNPTGTFKARGMAAAISNLFRYLRKSRTDLKSLNRST